MENRSVLQWDKDDCAAIGLVKFDLLGLGMLSALHYAIDLVAEHKGIEVDLAKLDLSEPAVYEMLQRADSVGVFQVESRAQMATLPRLKPRVFYDLVVEVALIRPGPIQGGSVHPYIRRRNGLEPVTYDHPSMEPALRKTLGVPLFQEQLMQLAVDCAGFSAAEADQLRRAMGSKRSTERMRTAAGPVLRRHARAARHHRRGGRPDLREAGGVRQFRFPGKPFAVLRVAGVLLVVVQAAPSGGVLRGAAAGAADGLLLAAVAGGRRPPARGHRARARRQRQPGARRRWRTRAPRCGWASAASATSATSWPSRSSRSERPTGRSISLLDLTGRVQLSVPQTEALATAGALGCFGITRREGAVGGRRGRHAAAGPAAGRGVVVAHPGAAGHDRAGTGRRRRLGHRHLAGQLSHPVPAGGPRRDRRGPRRPAAGGARRRPGCWWPGR